MQTLLSYERSKNADGRTDGQTAFQLYIVDEAEKPSVRLSVLSFWHAVNSAVCALIETGLARYERGVFEEHKVYFYKPV